MPANRWGVALAGWATQATRAWGGLLGRAEDSSQKANLSKKIFFFFKIVL
jgi:hypothetical protein